MQTYLIVGNIFSLLCSLCIAVSVVKKNKKDLLWWQILDTTFCILSNIALFSYAAVTTNAISLIRNYLAYKSKFTKSIMLVLLFACIMVGLWANNRGIIGLFPIAATAVYTIFMYTSENEQQLRWALIANLSLWFVHDAYIQAYPSALTDVVLSLWTLVQALKNRKRIRLSPAR